MTSCSRSEGAILLWNRNVLDIEFESRLVVLEIVERGNGKKQIRRVEGSGRIA